MSYLSEFPLLSSSSQCSNKQRIRGAGRKGKHLILECERKAQANNLDKGTANKAISPLGHFHCALRESNANPKGAGRNQTFLRD